jgi:hypothetical protein
MFLEKSIIDAISFSLPHFTKTQKGWKFQCPYCQHGLKDHKGRHYGPGRVKGYLVPKDNSIKFRCFLCDEHKEFASFLRDHFPKEFLDYVRQREALGLTGYQTNCPSLKTVLKKQGVLPRHPPAFNKQKSDDPEQDPSTHSPVPAVTPSMPAPTGPKVTKLPPMRSPQQQAGQQSRLNHQVKQRQQQRRLRESW